MISLKEAIEQRHSVRAYQQKLLSREVIELLETKIREVNDAGRLHLQLVVNEPKAFESRLARYGKFANVTSYIAVVGKKGSDLDERAGYYGEQVVLYAQQLGLNTCWVGLTFKKIPGAFTVGENEKLIMVISIGYGENQGTAHKGKSFEKVTEGTDHPEWFKEGVRCALLAPTAMNQQKFVFSREGDVVLCRAGFGPYAGVDLGIVKYHFEAGAGRQNFYWKK